jgi:Tol biopolymer transport system component
MQRKPVHLRALVTLLAVVVCTLAVAASATPPGKNGQVAFARYAKGQPGGDPSYGSIFTIGTDGRGERRVTRPPAGASDTQPDWSADGSRIVFVREFDDKPFEVWSVRPNGSDLRRIDPGCPPGVVTDRICEEDAPAWSPDGTRLAFGNPYGGLEEIGGETWIDFFPLAVMDADGSNLRHLTHPQRHQFEDSEPVWSPDGTRMAFRRLNGTATPRGKQAIFVLDLASGAERRVTPWNLNAGDHPDWSPDGRRILFRSTTSDLYGPLYTVRPDGTGLKQLTRFKPRTEVLSSSFSPDGKFIVLSRSGRGGLPDLFIMRSDGTRIRQLTRTTRWESAPDWGPAK